MNVQLRQTSCTNFSWRFIGSIHVLQRRFVLQMKEQSPFYLSKPASSVPEQLFENVPTAHNNRPTVTNRANILSREGITVVARQEKMMPAMPRNGGQIYVYIMTFQNTVGRTCSTYLLVSQWLIDYIAYDTTIPIHSTYLLSHDILRIPTLQGASKPISSNPSQIFETQDPIQPNPIQFAANPTRS